MSDPRENALQLISDHLSKKESLVQSFLRAGDTGLDGRMLVRLAIMAVSKNKDLQLCHPITIVNSLCVAAALGLDPTVGTGKFWLIPRWNSKQQCKECTPLIGYKGLTELAMRHPRVMSINPVLVFQGEDFEVDPTHPTRPIRHRMRFDVEKTEATLTHAYAQCFLKGSRFPIWECMSKAQIDGRKARSDAGRAGKGPWATDYLAMARKTILRALIQGGTVPTREEMSKASMAEDAVENEVPMDRLENLGLETPPGTPAEEPMAWPAQAVDVEHTEVPADRKKEPIDPAEMARERWRAACEANSVNGDDGQELVRIAGGAEFKDFKWREAGAVTLSMAAEILMKRQAR